MHITYCNLYSYFINVFSTRSCRLFIIFAIIILLMLFCFGHSYSYLHHQRSWVAHSSSLPNYVSHFSGREKQINDIIHWLDPHNTDVRVVSIVGPPGFGKSSLAIQVGHEMIDQGVVYSELCQP